MGGVLTTLNEGTSGCADRKREGWLIYQHQLRNLTTARDDLSTKIFES